VTTTIAIAAAIAPAMTTTITATVTTTILRISGAHDGQASREQWGSCKRHDARHYSNETLVF
jgi:hypothetical protein